MPWILLLVILGAAPVRAQEWPSLFRGVVVADADPGIRIVSVEQTSLAFEADLRPEDLILQIDGHQIDTIDEFATMSLALKGKSLGTTLVVLRNGQPREVRLSLYSKPILTGWDLPFIPDYNIRFADPAAAVSYWMNLARGFREVNDQPQRLNALLNALHYQPTNVELALEASVVMSKIAQEKLAKREMAQGVTSMHQSTAIMSRLFDHPLSDDQLAMIKTELSETLSALRQLRSAKKDS